MIQKVYNSKTNKTDKKVVEIRRNQVMATIKPTSDILNLSIFINNRSSHFNQLTIAMKMIQKLCNGKIDKTDEKVIDTTGRQNTIEGEDERGQEKIIKQSIKTIVIIVTGVIIMIVLISKVKLRLLLPKNGRYKSPQNFRIYKLCLTNTQVGNTVRLML